MRAWIWLLLAVLPLAGWGDGREAVYGRWVGDQSVLEISERDGKLSARVVALDDPVYREDEEFGPVGAPRRDDLNPIAEKRQQPILGMELLSEYRFENGKWQGKIYDPESGNTYSSHMRIGRRGELHMRGYLGIPMFGRTATFQPLGDCADRAKEMPADPGLDSQACE